MVQLLYLRGNIFFIRLYTDTHTHTHTHIYINIYIYIYTGTHRCDFIHCNVTAKKPLGNWLKIWPVLRSISAILAVMSKNIYAYL